MAGAVVNLVAAPSTLGGTGLYAFYSAAGWMTYIGQLARELVSHRQYLHGLETRGRSAVAAPSGSRPIFWD